MRVVNFQESFIRDVDFLIGGAAIETSPLEPYCDEVVEFLNRVSHCLMQDKRTRGFPDVVSFAYWCRRANVFLRREEAFRGDSLFESRVGRGLVFHVAPSNVPVNFAFSFAFGLLSGNANVVRVPSRPFDQIAIICDALRYVLPHFANIFSRTAIVRYPRESEATSYFCSLADARIIWGGDDTVKRIRALDVRPRCIDIVFPDRYSAAVIDAESIADLSEDELEKVARNFYNDTYLMDQNACSSPQMVFWIYPELWTKERFWRAVRKVAQDRYHLQGAVVMDKYVQLCSDVIEGKALVPQVFDGLLCVVNVAELPDTITDLRGKGGFFYEHDVNNVSDILPFVTERFQTISYYGIEPHTLQKTIMSSHVRGVDRIVPIGQAMDIDVVWDGYDIVGCLSRIVDVR